MAGMQRWHAQFFENAAAVCTCTEGVLDPAGKTEERCTAGTWVCFTRSSGAIHLSDAAPKLKKLSCVNTDKRWLPVLHSMPSHKKSALGYVS